MCVYSIKFKPDQISSGPLMCCRKGFYGSFILSVAVVVICRCNLSNPARMLIIQCPMGKLKDTHITYTHIYIYIQLYILYEKRIAFSSHASHFVIIRSWQIASNPNHSKTTEEKNRTQNNGSSHIDFVYQTHFELWFGWDGWLSHWRKSDIFIQGQWYLDGSFITYSKYCTFSTWNMIYDG